MLELAVMSWPGITLLLIVPAAAALLLRGAKCPGAAVLGGVVGGILLGPAIFGRIAPESYQRLWVGGVEQRQTLEQLQRQSAAYRLAAGVAETDPATIEQTLAAQRRDIAAARDTLHAARWRAQRPFRAFTGALAALTLLGAGFMKITQGDRRQGLLGASSIGVWAAALPGACAYVAMTRWWGYNPPQAALAAAAVAIGPWTLTTVDRDAADRAELGGARMLERAGWIASALAIIAAAAAMLALRDTKGLPYAAPLLALPLGWILPRPKTRLAPAIVQGLCVPALAATAAVKIDLFTDFAFVPFIIFILLSGDARWLGAFIGAMLPGGRRGLRTMRLVLGAAACGPTQLAVTALAVHAWALPREIVFPLIAGAVVIEITTPARRSMARHLAETEQATQNEM